MHGVTWSLLLNVLFYIGFSLPPGAFANRAAASEYFRAFRFHTDRSELPPVALFGNGGRTHNHDRALSRRGTHAIGV